MVLKFLKRESRFRQKKKCKKYIEKLATTYIPHHSLEKQTPKRRERNRKMEEQKYHKWKMTDGRRQILREGCRKMLNKRREKRKKEETIRMKKRTRWNTSGTKELVRKTGIFKRDTQNTNFVLTGEKNKISKANPWKKISTKFLTNSKKKRIKIKIRVEKMKKKVEKCRKKK